MRLTTPDEQKGSIFQSAMRAASGLKDASHLPDGYHLLPALAYARCHHPVFASTRTSITDKQHAENLGKAIGDLLTQAAGDAGYPHVRVASIVWKDQQSGKFMIGMAAGTNDKEDPRLERFPSQQVIDAVGKLRKELIGTGPDHTSPLWDFGAVEEKGKGLVPTYRFEATDERGKNLQRLFIEIMKVQGGRYKLEEDGPNPVLRVPKEELERLAGLENRQAPPLP